MKIHFPVDAENLCTSTIHMRPTCLHRYKVGNLRTATSHSRSHELPGAADGEGITIVVGQLFVSCVSCAQRYHF